MYPRAEESSVKWEPLAGRGPMAESRWHDTFARLEFPGMTVTSHLPVRTKGRQFVPVIILLGAILLPGGRAGPPGTGAVIVHRTMLPDCGPSSFAVALGPDLGFTYDPGRGGINYAWRGAFVDLSPTWKAKINAPAEVRGAIAYRETVRFPLRLTRAGGEPRYVFKGYVLLPDAVQFLYLLDGMPVREEIRATPDGRGLVRRFQVDTAVEGWSYAVEPQPAARISSRDGAWNEARTALTAPGGRDEFTLQIDLAATPP